MNEGNNMKTVKDAYLAYEERNLKVLLGFLTEDVHWFQVGPPDLIPTAGTRKGREQVEEFFAVLEASEDVQSLRPQRFVSQGDTVVVLGQLRTRIRASGTVINSPWVHVFTLKNGKISEFQSFYDSAAAVEAYANVRSRSARVGTSPAPRTAVF
jgi:ketosteroid isomerase-like protein